MARESTILEISSFSKILTELYDWAHFIPRDTMVNTRVKQLAILLRSQPHSESKFWVRFLFWIICYFWFLFSSEYLTFCSWKSIANDEYVCDAVGEHAAEVGYTDAATLRACDSSTVTWVVLLPLRACRFWSKSYTCFSSKPATPLCMAVLQALRSVARVSHPRLDDSVT